MINFYLNFVLNWVSKKPGNPRKNRKFDNLDSIILKNLDLRIKKKSLNFEQKSLKNWKFKLFLHVK